ncbi:MAG: tetratricopeptide repeat protein [Phycisphaeraceae bacterium]|nr:MAG: tetratricopeptide repeat protein [Phycisphaeraceae bacterium]
MKRTGHLLWVVVLAALAVVVVLAWRSMSRPSGGLTQAGPAPTAGPTSAPADGQTIEALIESARRYAANQETGKAETVLRASVAQHPDEPRLRAALGEILVQEDKKEEALAQYQKLIADGQATADIAFRAGSLAAVLGDPALAAEEHELAQKLDPTNPDYPIHLAQAQIALGKIDEAKASLTRAAVLDDGRAIVWGMLAELALRENKLDMAEQHIAKARRLEPNVVAWRVIEARVFKRRGEAERALLLLGGLGEPDRWDPAVVKAMAECLGMLDRQNDALSLYEVAIEKRPGEPELRYEAALWAERLGKTDRALELARQASMMGEQRAKAVVERLGG